MELLNDSEGGSKEWKVGLWSCPWFWCTIWWTCNRQKKKKFRIIYILHSIHRIPSRYPLKKLETSFGRSVVRIKRILIQNKTSLAKGFGCVAYDYGYWGSSFKFWSWTILFRTLPLIRDRTSCVRSWRWHEFVRRRALLPKIFMKTTLLFLISSLVDLSFILLLSLCVLKFGFSRCPFGTPGLG